MSTSETKNDEILQSDVVAALRKVPTIPAAHIGVSATSGAITLTGDVETVNQRFDAVEAAQNVDGVLAVADEIHVREFGNRDRTDTGIAVDVARVLSNVGPGLDLVDLGGGRCRRPRCAPQRTGAARKRPCRRRTGRIVDLWRAERHQQYFGGPSSIARRGPAANSRGVCEPSG
jgi:BON domain